MAALIIIGVVLLVLFLIGLVKITLHIDFDEQLYFCVSVLGINIYSNKKPKREQRASAKKQSDGSPVRENGAKNTIKKIYHQKGLKYTVDLFAELLKIATQKFRWLLKRLKIRNFKMSLSVVGKDAAETAITYGAVCSVVYPAVTFIDTNFNFKAKKIDVYADFDKKDVNFSIGTDINASVIVIVLLAVGCLVEFYKVYKTVKTDLDNI